MEGHFRKLGVFVVVLLFTATFAIAQGIVTGSVSGAVQDPQGAMVSGATVTAKNLGTNQEFKIQTNTSGQYTLRGLPPGTYNVTIEAPNFRSAQITNTVVAVGRDSALGTTQLAVGAPTETVNVEGTAPLVESTTSQISTTFEAKKVSALPLGGSLDDVALFVPGVVATGNNDFSNTNGAGLSSNGQRGRSNNFQIDGQSNNDNSVAGPSIFFANQDALSEGQVITNYSAEYGRNMGSVVNYVTKSGTNAFHGSAFEIYRGSVFDSLTNAEKSPLFGFCLAGQTPAADGCNAIEVTKYVDNRFGGAVGGPIWKDRVWFYASSNEGRIRRGGSPSSSNPRITPTPNGINQLKALFPNSPGVQALAAIGPAAISAGKPTFSNLTTRTISSGAVSGPVEFGTITRFLVRATDDHESTGRVDAQITSKD